MARKNLAENRVLIISYLTIILLISLICRTEMLPKNSLLETSVLCSSSYTKERSNIYLPMVSSCCSTSYLNLKKNSVILTRTMMSQRVVTRAINELHNVPRTNIAQYATHRVCDAEKAPTDPQALKNNPAIPKKNKLIRHPEIRRQECSEDIGCKNKSCPTLCSPAKGAEKATGHLTHGNPQNPYATTIEKLDSVDAKGDPKDQNSVFYKNAHNVTSPGIENVQATSYINQPHIASKIITHEDKS